MTKTTFDKARVIGFTDAVFSIALTLLVLEVTIPSYRAVTDYGTLGVLRELIPNFIGLVVSFFVTALYWIANLRITKFISEFDNKLMWLNLFLLLFIVLLPFSTSFYVNGFSLTGPFVFYCANLSMIGLFNYLMIRYIVKKERTNPEMSITFGKIEKTRALVTSLIWVLSGLLAFIFPRASRIVFVLIFALLPLIKRYHTRKLNPRASGK